MAGVQGGTVMVTVHSIGSVAAPASTVALVDQTGTAIATASVPVLDAPLVYEPKTATVTLTAPSGMKLSGCSVVIDPEGKLTEITRRNNTVVLP